MDYNALAGEYAAHRFADPEVLRALCRDVTAGTSVLEVGCGTGNYLIAVHETTGAHCFGVDPSREMLAQAQARSSDVQFVAGIAEALPFPAATFDLVFSIEVVHHLGDVRSAVVEAFRALRPGGRLCIGTEDEVMLKSRVHARYFPETVCADLARYPAIATLREAMTAAGFVDVCEERTSSPYRVTDSRPYRDKAFSSLHLIDGDAFRRGLERLERDLAREPIDAAVRHVLLSGVRP